MTPEQSRVMHAIEVCRTASLGGHVEECSNCGQQVVSYNSCRNRHCPKCQGLDRAAWLEARLDELLDVPYFHLVFTLPDKLLSALALQNKRVVYDILFKAASSALMVVARDPKYLGAQIGFSAVLHTWGQTLVHHPHVHIVVAGGGLAIDRSRWIASHGRFFLPVRLLSRIYRRLFVHLLHKAFEHGELEFHGECAHLASPEAFFKLLNECFDTDWVVYCKPPFAGPEKALGYLSRYTHRIAISNHRLVSMEDDHVAFRYKDYRTGQESIMRLHAHEFIRRFFMHVVPPGFTRIRYYGFMANRHRADNLELCRSLLPKQENPQKSTEVVETPPESGGSFSASDIAEELRRCPKCKQLTLIVVAEIPPRSQNLQSPIAPACKAATRAPPTDGD
jgi:hypothetical protein